MAQTQPERYVALLLAGLMCAVALAQESPAVRKFDFGDKKQSKKSIWKDFTPVERAEDYTQEKGYGFENPISWHAYEAHRHDPLSADAVCLIGPFRVDVPPGKYKVYLLTGNAGSTESGLGENSAELPRANDNPCP